VSWQACVSAERIFCHSVTRSAAGDPVRATDPLVATHERMGGAREGRRGVAALRALALACLPPPKKK